MSSSSEDNGIVIIGAGIVGLATALALHREKLIKEGEELLAWDGSIKFWKELTLCGPREQQSASKPTAGAHLISWVWGPLFERKLFVYECRPPCFSMFSPHGQVIDGACIAQACYAILSTLGPRKRVADCIQLQERLIRTCRAPVGLTAMLREFYLDNGQTEEALLGEEEGRYLLRSDLLQSLFDCLPARTVRFGCHIVRVKTDPGTSHSTLQFHDGSVAIAKILIGCDGVNSIVAESLKLKPTRQYPMGAVRGITNYPNGHGFSNDHIRIKKGNVLVGRVPVDDKIVYWYIARPQLPGDSEILGNLELIRQDALKAMEGCPQEYLEMVENSDDSDLSFTKVSYRAPWDLVLGNFCRGTVTVAGDAMHVMGPFLGQGGAAGLEDAVVLGRCLARELCMGPNGDYDGRKLVNGIGKAFDEYVKERRMRVARLSLQTYLTGILVATSSTFVTRLVLLALRILFRDAFSHAQYDCGRL